MNLRPVNLAVQPRDIPPALAEWCVAIAQQDPKVFATIREHSFQRTLVELTRENEDDDDDGEDTDCCGFVYTDKEGRSMFAHPPFAASDVELVTARDFVEAHYRLKDELHQLEVENERLAAFRRAAIGWGSLVLIMVLLNWLL